MYFSPFIWNNNRFSVIVGYRNTSLKLDSETGWITVATNNHGFDSEEMPEYSFLVEARDADGEGKSIIDKNFIL